jgi:signal transduction histidine kinase
MGALQDAEDPGDNLMLTRSELSLPPKDAYRIVAPDGREVAASANWQQSYPMPASVGFSDFRDGRHRYRELRIDSVRVLDAGVEGKGGGVLRPVSVVYVAATGHLWGEILDDVQFSLLTSLAVVLLTAAVLAWYVRRALRPLRGLAEEAARVSANSWGFAPSAEVLATRELAPLATSIGTLLGNMEAEFAARRRFVSDAAHELKTAVAVMKSSLQLLAMRQRSVEEFVAGMERQLTDTERMELLVQRMLTLGRVDEQDTGSAASDLCAAVAGAARALEPLRELRNVTIDRMCEGEVMAPLAANDAEILCINLLSNALEHSSPGTTVRIGAQRVQGETRLVVADSGEGIPAEALPRLFERFYRVDPSRSRQTGGSGLGLAICHAIVSKAGGSIEVTSGLGRGTTVTVRFAEAAAR